MIRILSSTFIALVTFTTLSSGLSYAASAPPQTGTTWSIDPAHSKPAFSVRHMMISNVTGCFDKVSGTVHYDGMDIGTATVSAVIDASSIDTANAQRDTHLKSADFLDATKYPTITFKSKTIIPVGEHQAKIIGDLTMHGITKEVALDLQEITAPITDPRGKIRVGTTATAAINRKDFGISFNATMDNGGALVGDQIYITFEVELVKN